MVALDATWSESLKSLEMSAETANRGCLRHDPPREILDSLQWSATRLLVRKNQSVATTWTPPFDTLRIE